MPDFLTSPHARRRKLRQDIVIAVSITGAILLAVLVPMLWNMAHPTAPTAEASSGSTVTYEVRGSAKAASATYSTATGTVQNNIDIPLMNKAGEEGVTFTAESGQSLYISAQNQQDHGSIECIITVDGAVVSDNSSNGAYTIAQCSAAVP